MRDLQISVHPKVDDLAVNGLTGVEDSLAYKVEEIEKDLHNTGCVYGNDSNAMALDEPVKFTVIGGDDAWGTELLLTDGTVVESGDSTKKFDLNTLYIVSVSAANKISIISFRSGVKGTPLTAVTITAADDKFTKVGHGLSNGDTVYFSAITTTTGINIYTVYYVVGVDGNDFDVSLTSGGGAVTLTDDGSCTVVPLTQSGMGCMASSAAAINSDSVPQNVLTSRVPCDNTVSVRAKSETGQTISIGFLIGLHTYEG